MSKQKVIIIGAGAGGLSVANILAKVGYAVEVYEKNHRAGGRMGVLEKDGFVFDTGPSWYLMPEVYDHYFSLLGKKTADLYKLERLTPAYKVFFDYHAPITITSDLENNQKLFESIEPGAGLALKSYIDQAEKNYELSLRYFLYNPFTRFRNLITNETVRHLYKIGSLAFRPLHPYVSKRFKNPCLQQILEYPMVFLGASPYNAPALYQLMSYLDFKQGVFYPKGGMYEITKSLQRIGEDLGVIYHFNTPVERINTSNRKATGITVAGKDIAADIVISNADVHFTETSLLAQENRSYPESYWQKRSAGPSALLLYLGVKGSVPELNHHNLFFTEDWKQNFDAIYKTKKLPHKPSIYVCKPSATDKTVAPKGHENIFVLVPLPAGVYTNDKQVDDYINKTIGIIEEQAGITDLHQRIVTKDIRSPQFFGDYFNSWQNTALGLSHTLTQSAFLRPSIKSKKLDNLYYVGASSQPGIGVPMCLISAELVYKHITKDHSPGPLPTLEIR